MTFSARLAAATVLLAAFVGTSAAHSQPPYPTQSILLVVPYAAGGLPDTVARIFGRRLQARVNQPVVIENRPGASGAIAARALANAPADGHTLMVTDGAIHSTNPALNSRLAYNPDDILPVVLLARAPLFLATHEKIPARTLGEFIDYVRNKPGQLNYGSSGLGSVHHLSMESIKSSLGLNMMHVPFKGVGETIPALLGGHIDVMFAAYPAFGGAASDGRVKLLATNSAERSPLAPDLPSISEYIPGFEFAPMIGLYGKAGTQPGIIDQLAHHATAIVADPDLKREFRTLGIEAVGSAPEQFRTAIRSEVDRVARAIQSAGLKPQ